MDLMLLIKSSSGCFVFLISAKLSIRLDSEVDINLKLSMNFNLYIITLPFLSSFLIGKEKVTYFSVFSPIQLKLPLNSFANCLIMK